MYIHRLNKVEGTTWSFPTFQFDCYVQSHLYLVFSVKVIQLLTQSVFFQFQISETLLCPLRCPLVCERAEQKQTKHLQQKSEINSTPFPCPNHLTPKPHQTRDTQSQEQIRLGDEKGILTIFEVKPVEVHPFYQITQSFRFKRRKAWVTDFSMEKRKFCNEHMWLRDYSFGEIIFYCFFLSY